MSSLSVISPPSPNITTQIPQDIPIQAPVENKSSSPWAQMFNGKASTEELTQFINGFLNTIIAEMKRADKKWKLMQQEQKRNFR